MNREDDKKSIVPNEASQAGTAGRSGMDTERKVDDNEHSYPGALDHVEGRMNNGELGSGITKTEEDDSNR